MTKKSFKDMTFEEKMQDLRDRLETLGNIFKQEEELKKRIEDLESKERLSTKRMNALLYRLEQVEKRD